MDPDARYHMPDYRSNRNLRGILEQFNYRHSSLRTTVETGKGIRQLEGEMANSWCDASNEGKMANVYNSGFNYTQ